jgi:hypothetical protein
MKQAEFAFWDAEVLSSTCQNWILKTEELDLDGFGWIWYDSVAILLIHGSVLMIVDGIMSGGDNSNTIGAKHIESLLKGFEQMQICPISDINLAGFLYRCLVMKNLLYFLLQGIITESECFRI